MDCKHCQTVMKDGKALIPVMGNIRNNFERGATVYPITAMVKGVKKCPTCGHSVSFHGMLKGEFVSCSLKGLPLEYKHDLKT